MVLNKKIMNVALFAVLAFVGVNVQAKDERRLDALRSWIGSNAQAVQYRVLGASHKTLDFVQDDTNRLKFISAAAKTAGKYKMDTVIDNLEARAMTCVEDLVANSECIQNLKDKAQARFEGLTTKNENDGKIKRFLKFLVREGRPVVVETTKIAADSGVRAAASKPFDVVFPKTSKDITFRNNFNAEFGCNVVRKFVASAATSKRLENTRLGNCLQSLANSDFVWRSLKQVVAEYKAA